MKNGRDGDTYHISTNEVISIRDLVKRICKKLEVSFDKNVEIVGERIGKDLAYHLDSSKLRAELGWKDRIALDQGIDKCIDWAKANFEVLKLAPQDYIHKA